MASAPVVEYDGAPVLSQLNVRRTKMETFAGVRPLATHVFPDLYAPKSAAFAVYPRIHRYDRQHGTKPA